MDHREMLEIADSYSSMVQHCFSQSSTAACLGHERWEQYVKATDSVVSLYAP